MKITFGMMLDGVRWSDDAATVGVVRLGPQGLLTLLETRLGLSGPETHPARRINQYQARLAALNTDKTWFHRSFEADPWSTAKQMLAWRDELVEAGWEGHAEKNDTPRLRELAALEKSLLPLALGRPDRLRQVLRSLTPGTSLALSRITVQGDLQCLPPVWQQVLSRLERIGVMIDAAAATPLRKAADNLAIIQSLVTGSDKSKNKLSEQDDSLLQLKAANEWEAAQTIALWLSTQTEANDSVAIICGADTDLLDQALVQHGLPQLGHSQASPWRAALQVLPLVLANAWTPVDVRRLVELLNLPLAPVHRFAARELLKALRQEPGTGGQAWAKALEEVAVKYRERQEGGGQQLLPLPAEQYVKNLDTFLATDRHDPEVGIPEALKARCQWVIDWLGWRMQDDALMVEAVSHALELQTLATGKGRLSRVMVERMLDSVIGTGVSAPDRYAQAAQWQVVTHPGQLVNPVKTVIWWGFNDPGIRNSTYWSNAERQALAAQDAEPEQPQVARRREAADWRRGLTLAQQHCLLVTLTASEGESRVLPR